eukprot:GHVO01018213.1.p1 GENE.GHVO01018213.1~~GHVO01018213.1.p1  ORF type:complete len:393 (-),score=35.43 GHVO01018213.1:7-1185(-)
MVQMVKRSRTEAQLPTSTRPHRTEAQLPTSTRPQTRAQRLTEASKTCSCCGRPGHKKEECHVYKDQWTCHGCGKKGHLRAVCRSTKSGISVTVGPHAESRENQLEAQIQSLQQQLEKLKIQAAKPRGRSAPSRRTSIAAAEDVAMESDTYAVRVVDRPTIRAIIPCMVGKVPTMVEVDSGAHTSVMGSDVHERLFAADPTLELQQSQIRPLGADRKPLAFRGEVTTTMTVANTSIATLFIVLDSPGPLLMSMEDMVALGITISDHARIGDTVLEFGHDHSYPCVVAATDIADIPPDAQQLLQDTNMNTNELGRAKGAEFRIELSTPTPVYARVRPASPQQTQAIEAYEDDVGTGGDASQYVTPGNSRHPREEAGWWAEVLPRFPEAQRNHHH